MTPQPGDILIVRTGSFAAAMIRLGAALAGQPNLANHVAVTVLTLILSLVRV